MSIFPTLLRPPQVRPRGPATAAADFPIHLEPVLPTHLLPAGGSGDLPPPPPSAVGAGLVLGDSVLWTEDVWVDAATLPGAGGAKAAKSASQPARPPQEVSPSHPRATLACSRTVAATVSLDSASRVTSAGGLAVAGLAAGGDGSTADATTAHARPAAGHAGAGHWGVAAHVTHAAAAAALASRELVLQVEWCAVEGGGGGSGTAWAELPRGKVVRRSGAVFTAVHAGAHRAPWEDEAGRWTLLEELRASYDA